MHRVIKTKIVALILAILACFPLLLSCDKSGGGNADRGEETQTCTVTFISNGGTEVVPQQVKQGEKAVKPLDPEKVNYVFLGWFNGEAEWNFETMKVNENVNLTAKWRDEFTQPYLPKS